MKREEINELFMVGNTTVAVIIPQNLGVQFTEGNFEDIIPNVDDDNHDYTICTPDDLPDFVKTCFVENLEGNELFDILPSDEFNVIYFVDNDTRKYVLIY